MRNYLTWLLPICFLAPVIALAETIAPDTLVKNVTEEVLTILRADKGIKAGNSKGAVALIENKVAPHFDFPHMTSLAVGQAWQKADADQRKALTSEFHTLLVRTYANSLTAFQEQKVSFKPLAEPSQGGEVTVRSQINKPGTQPITLDYSLAKSDDGWKVFDVTIANISLVTNYRSTFASEMNKGGLDGLLKALQEKNRRNEAAASPTS